MERRESAVSKGTMERLPAYLRYLKGEHGRGVLFVSSAEIASRMGHSSVSVRKDLALVSSVPGKPHLGFRVETLIEDIEKFLGYRGRTSAVIVGAGGLGRAILAYEGFENYGINIVAAFDNSPEKIGTFAGKTVYPLERLGEIAKRSAAKVGILAVPRRAAQEAFDAMVRAGIRAVLSFAPVHLNVPEGVTVQYEDLAVTLAALCGTLSD